MWLARQPVSAILRALRLDSGPPLFYLVARPFVLAAEALGGHDWLGRLPGLAALLAAGAAARALPEGRPRAIFLGLCAASPLMLLYSAEARAYALLAALDLALFLLVRKNSRGSGAFLATAAVAAAALYTHYLAIFFVAGLAAGALVSGRRRALLPLGAGALAFAPWIPVLAGQPAAATAWMQEPAARSLAGILSTLGGGGRIPAPFGPELPAPLFGVAAAAGLLLLVFAGIAAREDAEARLAFAAAALTLAGALAASLWRPVAFAGRTEMACLPVWIWAVARASETSQGARWAAALAAAAGAAGVALLLLAPPRPSPAAAVTKALVEGVRPHDAVVASSALYLPARLASDRGRIAAPVLAYPSDLARHPGWFAPEKPGNADELAVRSAAGALAPGARLWLALHPAYQSRRLGAILDAVGPAQELLHGPDAALTVVEKRADAGR